MNLSTSSSKEARLFERNLGKFLLFFLLTAILLSSLNWFTIIKTLKNSSHFVLPVATDTVILGDSYTMTGLDPGFRANTLNGAMRAELIPFTYHKMKFICEHNPQVKNLVISLSYHSLTMNKEKTLKSPETVRYYCDTYFALYDTQLKRIAFTMDSSYYVSWLKYSLGFPIELSKNIGIYLRIISGFNHYKNYSFWGGYQTLVAPESGSSVKERIFEHYYKFGEEIEMSNIMIDYFEVIIKYCNAKGIRLFVITPPVQPAYEEQVPEGYKQGLREIVGVMKKKYSNLFYFDYGKLIFDESEWRDADHLNSRGSERFSQLFFIEMNKIIEGESYDHRIP
jgi:hypothetical protein